MNKVLLATSFIVAFSTPVLAKSTLYGSGTDFTFSGKHEFNMQTWDDNAVNTGAANDSKMSNDSTITIKAKTVLPNGMTLGATLLDQEDGSHDTDGVNAYVSGDFGKVVFGGNTAGDTYSIDGRVAGDSYHGTASMEYEGGEEIGVSGEQDGISYHFGNDFISAGIGFVDAGTASKDDTVSYGVKIPAGPVTIQAAYEDQDNVEEVTSIGMELDVEAATLTLAQNTMKDDDATYDYTGWSYGVETNLSDTLALAAHVSTAEDDKDAGFDYQETAITLTKTIAPGLKAHASWTDYEEKQTGSSATDEIGTSYNLGVTVSF
jgi:hypothetical protein